MAGGDSYPILNFNQLLPMCSNSRYRAHRRPTRISFLVVGETEFLIPEYLCDYKAATEIFLFRKISRCSFCFYFIYEDDKN